MVKKNKKIIVLLDAHAIIHRAYHAMPDFATSRGEPTGGLYGVLTMLMKIIETFKPFDIIACFDLPKPTFRHDAYDGYKAQRKSADDDLVRQLERAKDIFKAWGIPVLAKEGFEADDLLGTVAEHLKKEKDVEIIIASGDMDTLQLVDSTRVKVFTLRKGINDTVLYDEDAVRARFGFGPELLPDFKGLRGDPSDNIVGIKGIGEKTATTLITTFGTIENIYKNLRKGDERFIEVGIKGKTLEAIREGEEEALFSKTLATIRRDALNGVEMSERPFLERVSFEEILTLLDELEIRSLQNRIRALLGKKEEEEEILHMTDEEHERLRIMLWVLRSDIVNATKEEIFRFTKTKTKEEAEEVLRKELKKEKLLSVFEDIEEPIIPIIHEAEKRGILVDVSYAKKLSKEYHQELSLYEKEIYKHAGREFNVNSPKQLGEVLFDEMKLHAKNMKKTAGGARSTRESELLKLKDIHPIIESLLKYRELQKLLSTYIDNIPKMLDGEGALHTTLNQAGTSTGRFSSSNPNLQNIPVKEGHGTKVRNMFVARKGYSFVSLDYSQIEMRILAELSGDQKLRSIFKNGEDVHAAVAAYMFDVEEEKVSKDMRRAAKTINFGIVYGMGVNALKDALGKTRAEAQIFYNNYFEKFSSIARYFDEVKRDARTRGYTETLFGRRRYVEGIDSPIPYIQAAAERQAGNAPLQGTAADIIKLAMKKADTLLREKKLENDAHLLLQVHDDLLYEVRNGKEDEVSSVLKNAMEEAATLSVPLSVNISKGVSWGNLK